MNKNPKVILASDFYRKWDTVMINSTKQTGIVIRKGGGASVALYTIYPYVTPKNKLRKWIKFNWLKLRVWLKIIR